MTEETFLLLMLDVEPGDDDVLNAWYDLEHIPQMLGIPGCLTAIRYRAEQGDPRYLALYGLQHIDVLASQAAQEVRPQHPKSTPWSRWMLTRFRNFRRGVYDVLAEAGGVAATGDRPPLLLLGYAQDSFTIESFRDWFATEVTPRVAVLPGGGKALAAHISPASSNALDAPGHYLLLVEAANAHRLPIELAASGPVFTGLYGDPGRVELAA